MSRTLGWGGSAVYVLRHDWCIMNKSIDDIHLICKLCSFKTYFDICLNTQLFNLLPHLKLILRPGLLLATLLNLLTRPLLQLLSRPPPPHATLQIHGKESITVKIPLDAREQNASRLGQLEGSVIDLGAANDEDAADIVAGAGVLQGELKGLHSDGLRGLDGFGERWGRRAAYHDVETVFERAEFGGD